MKILGITALGHDASVSVVENGSIKFAAHSERYTRKKFDETLSQQMIDEALQGEAPHAIAFYEQPWLKKTRQLRAGQYKEVFTTSNLPTQYLKQFPLLQGIPVATFPHHLSHAAAGALTSPFRSAAIVVADAIGEWETTTIWKWKSPMSFEKVFSVSYPHSLGLFYTAFTTLVGLRPNDEEYIMMGMAAYGSPVYAGKILRELFRPNEICSLRVNMHRGIRGYLPDVDPFDIAASAQAAFEVKLGELMGKAVDLTGEKNLVYMGGAALNCLANSNVLPNYFDNTWIMPNPGDAGSSLGAAALLHGKKVKWVSPYLGTKIQGRYPVESALSELLDGKIVGVANGRAEFGPRALGNRSLFADPRKSKDAVNAIKQRQQFRPFAPVILEEHVHDYFRLPPTVDTSPYMQYVADCLVPKKTPAIVHADGTSRVQTVNQEQHPALYSLIKQFYAETGCPMLLNTSLNIRGEPIVNNEQDAAAFEKAYGVRVFTKD